MGMLNRPRSTPVMGTAAGGGQMNFNNIPNIPTFQANGPVLPPFNDLQANSMRNVHLNASGLSMTSTPTHSHSMSMTMGTAEQEDSGRKSNGKNASRKRKRDEKERSSTS